MTDTPTDSFDAAVAALRAGGVVLAPTDTVLGLIALPSSPEAVARIFELKARPVEARLPIFVPSADAAVSLGLEVNDLARRLLDGTRGIATCTTVLGFHEGPRVDWLAGRAEAAVRVPNDAALLAILDRTGPLVSTSANRHGNPTPQTSEAAAADLTALPDHVIPGSLRSTAPSTIVNCRTEPAEILREGAHLELVRSLLRGDDA